MSIFVLAASVGTSTGCLLFVTPDVCAIDPCGASCDRIACVDLDGGHHFDAGDRVDAGGGDDAGTIDAGGKDAGPVDAGRPDDAGVVVPVCGNDVIETGEECDDGNALAGDGCSPSCEIESGTSCYPEPVGCVSDGITVMVGAGANLRDVVNGSQSGFVILIDAETYDEGSVDGTLSVNNKTLTIAGLNERASIHSSENGALFYVGGNGLLTLANLHLTTDGDADQGILVEDTGTVRVTRSQIGPARREAVVAREDSTFEMTRTRVVDTSGINLLNQDFLIENCEVINNTGTLETHGDVGGIRVHTTPFFASAIRFTTVVGNNTAAGGIADGIHCNNGVIFTVGRSIVTANGNSDIAQCNGLELVLSTQGVVGIGLTYENPDFVDVGGLDFRLNANSPAIDRTALGPDLDLRGVSRPQGASRDIGAHEYVESQ